MWENIRRDLGQEIKRIRESKAITQKQLAKRVELRQPYIQLIEAGKEGSLNLIIKILDELGHELDFTVKEKPVVKEK